jgi:hypothetical protein
VIAQWRPPLQTFVLEVGLFVETAEGRPVRSLKACLVWVGARPQTHVLLLAVRLSLYGSKPSRSRALLQTSVCMTCSGFVALCCAVLQLPAGVIEKGETVEELALRELKEETGVYVCVWGGTCGVVTECWMVLWVGVGVGEGVRACEWVGLTALHGPVISSSCSVLCLSETTEKVWVGGCPTEQQLHHLQWYSRHCGSDCPPRAWHALS